MVTNRPVDDAIARPLVRYRTDDEATRCAVPLTVADVVGHLGVSEDVVRDLLRKEKLRGAKVGGQWRIRSEDLAEYVMATFERAEHRRDNSR